MAVLLRRRNVLQILATCALLVVAALAAVRTTAGIQGSGLRVFSAIGPISAVGSGGVTVGGVDYWTTGARGDIDGDPGKADQLHPGDAVSMEGTLLHGGRVRVGAASSARFSGSVRGAAPGVAVSTA